MFGQDQNNSLGNDKLNFGGGVTMPPGQQPMSLAPMSFPKQQVMPSGGTPMGSMNNMVAALMKKPSFMGGSPTGTGDMPVPTPVSPQANTGDMPPPCPVQPMSQDPAKITNPFGPVDDLTQPMDPQQKMDPATGMPAAQVMGKPSFMTPDNVSQALMSPATNPFGAFA